MAVSWGLIERYKFTACGALKAWAPSSTAAVYSITFKQDPLNRPKSHTVLYFGEAEDLAQETSSMHYVIEACKDGQVGIEDMYVFVHPMPGSSKVERTKVQHELVGDYRPRGNGF
jgi:hypothetical protein